MGKIAFMIGSSGWGGLEMNVLKLADWMRERQWDVVIFTGQETKIARKAEEMGFQIEHMVHRKYFDVGAAYSFSKLLRKSEIFKVMVFQNYDLDFIFLTKKIFFQKLLVVYQQHMQIGLEKKDWLHTLRYKAIDWWISPLNKLKKEVVQKTNFDPDKIRVIPLGVDIDQFYPPRYGQHEARTILNLPQNGIILGILGRIDPKKGQWFLIKATHELVKKGMNINLLIMGEPTINDPAAEKYNQDIKNYVKDNNLGDCIYIRDFSTNVQVFYQSIDIFALASERETYGMVTIEALLSKKPIIATNRGGTSEILGKGKFGMLYKYNDVDDFCKKIAWMFDNKDKTSELIRKGNSVALKKYSHHRACSMINDLLNGNVIGEMEVAIN